MNNQLQIAGNSVGAWRWALQHWEASPEHARMIANWERPVDENSQAARDANDPAKLASIIEFLLDAQGIESQALSPKDDNCCISFVDPCDCDVVRKIFTMPQARAFALRLLDAPADADVQKLIGDLAQ